MTLTGAVTEQLQRIQRAEIQKQLLEDFIDVLKVIKNINYGETLARACAELDSCIWRGPSSIPGAV